MNNVKGKISLGLLVLLVVVSLSVVFAETQITHEIVMSLTATYDGRTIEDHKNYEAVAGRVVEITVNPTHMDSSLIIYKNQDGKVEELARGTKTASFTVPNIASGKSIEYQLQATIDNDAQNYVGRSNNLVFWLTGPEATATQVEVTVSSNGTALVPGSTTEKPVGSKLTVAATTNKTFDRLVYQWDDGTAQVTTSKSVEITVPNFAAGTTHTLLVQASATDGTKSQPKRYTIRIPDNTTPVTPVTPVDDELIVEDWMKENKDVEGLVVSLRNDSEQYEKKNKNIYELGEEVTYYVDYKNGGKDIESEVRLVLNLPLDFDVVDAFGGTVDKEKKTITWVFPNGIEKDQAGTKVVKIKYTSLGKASKKSETIYPSAEIFVGTSKSPKDTSSVINVIFKDEDTTINDEHYPYMIGDLEAPTFRPDDGIKRAEGALVLARIFGINYSGTKVAGNEFSDLEDTYLEAQKAIVASSKMGLISGFPDGSFRPNERMTKAQFMRIIASYVEVKAEEENIKGLEVRDAENSIKLYKNSTNVYMTGATSTENHWAIPYVTLLARINMTPVSSTHKNLGLDEEITRAEVAQLVNFYLLRAPQESGRVQFEDVPRNHKLYGDILEATIPAHTYSLTNEGTEIRVDD